MMESNSRLWFLLLYVSTHLHCCSMDGLVFVTGHNTDYIPYSRPRSTCILPYGYYIVII